jgi:hypothetical protein
MAAPSKEESIEGVGVELVLAQPTHELSHQHEVCTPDDHESGSPRKSDKSGKTR